MYLPQLYIVFRFILFILVVLEIVASVELAFIIHSHDFECVRTFLDSGILTVLLALSISDKLVPKVRNCANKMESSQGDSTT